MIDDEVFQDYTSEARELLDEMDASLIRLEKEGGSSELLNNIFRCVHCIKGSAEYIGLERSGNLTHGVENLLDRLREGTIEFRPSIADFLFRVKDLISVLVEEVSETKEEKSDIAALMEELERFLTETGPDRKAPPAGERDAGTTFYEMPEPKEGEEPAEAFASEVEPELAEGWESGMVGPQDFQILPDFTVESETAGGQDEFPDIPDLGMESEAVTPEQELADIPGLDTEFEFTTAEGELRDFPDVEAGPEFTAEEPDLVYDSVIFEEAAKTKERRGKALPGPELEPPVFERLAEPEGGGRPEFFVDPEIPPGLETTEDGVRTPTEDLEASITLAETVPQVLNISLYLDDLEDGMDFDSLRSSILRTIAGLKKSLTFIEMEEAVVVLEEMENLIFSIDPTEERVPVDALASLRSLLEELHGRYPQDTFPHEEPTLPEPEVTPTEEEEPPVESTFLAELQNIPGVDSSLAQAIREAGFASMEQLARADLESLTAIPGMSRPTAQQIIRPSQAIPKRTAPTVAAAAPNGRSMLADVDEELLREFEGIFGVGEAGDFPEPALTEETFAPERRGDLVQELDGISEEADREIMEIFVGYGWEITQKLRPVVDKIRKGAFDRDDLLLSADSIKSMRSSSSYMDYQKLASFLDEWYERVLAASGGMGALSPENLYFMEEKLDEFQNFLKGVERALKLEPPALAEPAVPAARAEPRLEPPEKPVEPPRPRLTPPPPVQDRQIRAGVTPVRAEAPKETPEPTFPPDAEAEPLARVAAGPTEREVVDSDVAITRAINQEGPVVRTMRVDAGKVDILLNQVGELVVNRSYVEQLSLELKDVQRGLSIGRTVRKREVQALKDVALKVGEASTSLGRAATDLQEGVMKLRMLPVGQLFNRMPRLIRDLSRRVGKGVSLQVQGGDTEVDKRVIEQIYNPLVHLIRNAVDHGIEDRGTRKALGKNEEGSILLSAYSQGNQVVIDVEDDGGGIDTEAVLARAVRMGHLDSREAESLSSQEILAFLFIPGFSTSKKVTRTSGRGVGMDVVKRDVEKINGSIEIDSWRNRGTRVSIKIPLTLAIIQTLLIRFGRHTFAIPLTSIREIVQISTDEISTIEGFQVIKFREETIPVARMNEIFQLSRDEEWTEPEFLVLATTGDRTIGFLVEALVGEQDVVIKPLAEHVWKARGLAGSTILGDGTIALVLDVAELVEDIIARHRQMLGDFQRGEGEPLTDADKTLEV